MLTFVRTHLLREFYHNAASKIHFTLYRKEHVASLSSMMQIAGKKKNLAWNAKAKLVIKEEEKITKQNVKTLVDEEAAEAQRKKLMSKR